MTSNNDFLTPIKTDEFLPPISRWTTFGGMFILGVLTLSIPVSAVSKYKVTVKGQGVVRPSGELRIVQAATEGQIREIYVRENQVVKIGDPIATIDDSRLQTKKSQLQTNIQQANLQILQINAQMQIINTQIKAENDKLNGIINAAEAELGDRQRQYYDKTITTVSELQEAQANVQIAEQELQIGQSQLQTELTNLVSIQAALDTALAKQRRYHSVAKTGALSQNQLEEVELGVKQQKQALKAQKSLILIKKQTIKRLEQAVYVAKTRRDRAKLAINPSKGEVKVASERINQEKATGKINKAALEKEYELMIKQRMETEKQLEKDRSELRQVENELQQTTIIATADGIILQISLRNPGQNVRSGEEILKIVPNNVNQIIKAAVPSENKSKLRIGEKVQMRVSSCPYPDYGTLNGTVTAISPDAITPPQNNKNEAISPNYSSQNAIAPNAFYEVTIKPETLALGKGKNLCHIQLGMEGTVDIISHEETVLKFFLRKARLITDPGLL